MAKYEIKHACGHYQEHQIFGKIKSRDWQESNLEDKVCSECWKKSKQDEGAKMVADQIEKEDYVSEMTDGSEKQIEWAKKIKIENISYIENNKGTVYAEIIILELEKDDLDEQKRKRYESFLKIFEEQKLEILQNLKSNNSAIFWINNRDKDLSVDEAAIIDGLK
jgi:hypothetical protein